MRRWVSLITLAVILLLCLPFQTAQAAPVLDSQKQELAEKVAEQVVAGMPSWVDTDEEKVMYLFDYIVDTVTYEYNDDDQTAYGALVKGRCVCAGYAEGFALLLKTAGIEAGTEAGWSSISNMAHAWTYFYLGGIKLYSDPTWGDKNFSWTQIDGNPPKHVHCGVIQTEKQFGETHAEYIFLDGIYDGSGSDAGNEYSYAGILERNGVPVGHFDRETTPEEALPYFQVIHYDGTNALIRAVYYYEEGENDHHHTFAAGKAAEVVLESVIDSFEVVGREDCEVYYFGPIANFTPVPVRELVLRTSTEREVRKEEVLVVTAEVLPYNASNKRVIYSSSDTSVATVDNHGKVFGISEGTAVITATSVDGGYTESVEITITSDHYHDIRLERVDEIAPTCEEPGWDWYFICSCGTWFQTFEPVAAMEIKDHNIKRIPALGHAESAWLHDSAGHWKQCTRGGCGKQLQEKAAHSDANGDGACDICTYRTAVETPTQPTTVPPATVAPTTIPTTAPTGTTEPTTVPAETTVVTQPTTAPVHPTEPTVSQPASTTGTEAVPNVTTGTQVPMPGQSRQWVLWVVLGLAVLIPAGVVLLRKRKV